jgi:hypothetical protein
MNAQILPRCTEEKDAVLGDESQPASEDVEPDIADIVTVDCDLPTLQLDHPMVHGITNVHIHCGKCLQEESLQDGALSCALC